MFLRHCLPQMLMNCPLTGDSRNVFVVRVMGGTDKEGGTLRSVEVFDPRVGEPSSPGS